LTLGLNVILLKAEAKLMSSVKGGKMDLKPKNIAKNQIQVAQSPRSKGLCLGPPARTRRIIGKKLIYINRIQK
jgi:hypothetical protein